MKAAVLEAPQKLVIREVPEPVFSEYDVLCETLAVSICSGTDNNLFNNHPYHKIKFPTILGHEGIGRVIACGKKVKHFKVGDLITRVVNRLPENSGYFLNWGALAERSIATDWQSMKDDGLPEKEWHKHMIHRALPPNFDPIKSTLIITWRETYSFLSRMKPENGDSLLVVGSGANALAFTDHARNLGLETFVIGSDERRRLFTNHGAKIFISYKENDWWEKLNKKVKIAIDTIGKKENLKKIVPLLSANGKFGLYGLEDFGEYDTTLIKNSGFQYFSGEIYDEGSAHDSIIKLIEEKKLDSYDYMSKDCIFPLEKTLEAIKASAERKVLKCVVAMTSNPR